MGMHVPIGILTSSSDLGSEAVFSFEAGSSFSGLWSSAMVISLVGESELMAIGDDNDDRFFSAGVRRSMDSTKNKKDQEQK
jgi:hypothetical protein